MGPRAFWPRPHDAFFACCGPSRKVSATPAAAARPGTAKVAAPAPKPAPSFSFKPAPKPAPAPVKKPAASDSDDEEEGGGFFGLFGGSKKVKAPEAPKRSASAPPGFRPATVVVKKPEPPKPVAKPAPVPVKKPVSKDDGEDDEKNSGGFFGLFGGSK